jgi:hypothetical protein
VASLGLVLAVGPQDDRLAVTGERAVATDGVAAGEVPVRDQVGAGAGELIDPVAVR